jgi:hypothetical protein
LRHNLVMLADILSIAALVLAVASLGWQMLTWRQSGPVITATATQAIPTYGHGPNTQVGDPHVNVNATNKGSSQLPSKPEASGPRRQDLDPLTGQHQAEADRTQVEHRGRHQRVRHLEPDTEPADPAAPSRRLPERPGEDSAGLYFVRYLNMTSAHLDHHGRIQETIIRLLLLGATSHSCLSLENGENAITKSPKDAKVMMAKRRNPCANHR